MEKKKTSQEVKARTKKKARAIENSEMSRDRMSDKQLINQASRYMREASKQGVDILVDYDKETGLYTVRVKGENGKIECTRRRLPAIVNGLYLMGEKVRGIFFEYIINQTK